jgi:hypothetical protein
VPGVRAPLAVAALVLAACGAAPSTAGAPRWERLPRATVARTEVAAARVGDHAYVVGGFAAPSGANTDIAERYDLRRRRWRRIAPIPQAVNHAAAVGWRGDLYVLGGYAPAESPALWRYDPARGRWSRQPDAPTARGALAAGVIGDRLYAVGGARGGTALRTLEIYDLRRRRWSRGPSMRVAREHLAATVAGGRLYVLAGRVGGTNFTVAERYDPRRRRWERLPSMRRARGGIAAAAPAPGKVVVVGGEEQAGTIREVELFDVRARRWPPLPSPSVAPESPDPPDEPPDPPDEPPVFEPEPPSVAPAAGSNGSSTRKTFASWLPCVRLKLNSPRVVIRLTSGASLARRTLATSGAGACSVARSGDCSEPSTSSRRKNSAWSGSEPGGGGMNTTT